MRLERLIHTADLHFGEHHAGLAARLADAVERLRPQLVVVSGDLTRRARSHEFRAARRFLDGLAAPTLVVPGNHDIPLLSLRRAYAPYRKYRRHLHGDLEPEMAFDNARVRGLNTTVNWRWKEGWLRDVPEPHGPGGAGLTIFAGHHPLGARLAERLPERSPAILLHGHHHRAAVTRHGCVLEVGAATPTSPRRRDGSNGFNLLTLDGRRVTLAVHTVDSGGSTVRDRRRFDAAASTPPLASGVPPTDLPAGAGAGTGAGTVTS